MDFNNERKWKHFLSSIKSLRHMPTNCSTIKNKTNTNCLAKTFADQLLQKKGGTVKLKGSRETLHQYQYLAAEELIDTSPRNTFGNLAVGELIDTSPINTFGNLQNGKRTSLDFSNSSDRESAIGKHPQVDLTLSESSNDSESLLKSYNDTKTLDLFHEEEECPSPMKLLKKMEKVMENANEKQTEGTNITWNEQSDEICDQRPTLANMDTVRLTEFSANTCDDLPDNQHVTANKHVPESRTVLDKISGDIRDKQALFANDPMNERQEIISLSVSAEDIKYIKHDVQIERTRERDERIYSPSKKTDIDKPCSQWTVRDIAGYFVFDDSVDKLEFPDTLCYISVNALVSVQKDILRRLNIVSGADLNKMKSKDSDVLKKLKSIACTETGSRLILDSLLIPLCFDLGLRIEVDKNINCNYLPNCRFDYCILKGKNIIGCVEAKSVKGLCESSVAQAILQLMILQTHVMSPNTNEKDVGNFPLFAIVSDGHRFIFIQLTGDSLHFEHIGDKIKVREILEEKDLKTILQYISFLAGKDHEDPSDFILID